MPDEKRPRHITDLSIDEVSLVLKGFQPANQGATVVLMKTADGAPATNAERFLYEQAAMAATNQMEGQMPSVSEIVQKALQPCAADSEREAGEKRVIQKALAEGVTTVERIGAELAIESMAKAAAANDTTKSYATHYSRIMLDPANAQLAKMAMGY